MRVSTRNPYGIVKSELYSLHDIQEAEATAPEADGASVVQTVVIVTVKPAVLNFRWTLRKFDPALGRCPTNR